MVCLIVSQRQMATHTGMNSYVICTYLSFDRPETRCDRAKLNLTGHHDRRQTGRYF
jgi:hypothetical protein